MSRKDHVKRKREVGQNVLYLMWKNRSYESLTVLEIFDVLWKCWIFSLKMISLLRKLQLNTFWISFFREYCSTITSIHEMKNSTKYYTRILKKKFYIHVVKEVFFCTEFYLTWCKKKTLDVFCILRWKVAYFVSIPKM